MHPRLEESKDFSLPMYTLVMNSAVDLHVRRGKGAGPRLVFLTWVHRRQTRVSAVENLLVATHKAKVVMWDFEELVFVNHLQREHS
jgi:hypothetical protein